jgi:hypothetical protein
VIEIRDVGLAARVGEVATALRERLAEAEVAEPDVGEPVENGVRGRTKD